MKIVFIINPIAGGKKTKTKIINLINKNFINHQILYTKKRGDAILLTKQSIKKKRDMIVAVGGDGTVNECAQALVNTEIPLGIIPCGSGNGFAYYFGIKKDPEISIQQLINGKKRKIDTGRINNQVFVNVSGIGFDAHIANLFSKSKRRGLYNYIKLILAELSYPVKKFDITYANNSKRVNAFMIAFANTSQYGNNIYISPNAKVDDGLINVMIIKEFPKWNMLLFFLKLLQGKIHSSKYVEEIKTDQILINGNINLIHLDGEPRNIKLPITIKVSRKDLNILIPNV